MKKQKIRNRLANLGRAVECLRGHVLETQRELREIRRQLRAAVLRPEMNNKLDWTK